MANIVQMMIDRGLLNRADLQKVQQAGRSGEPLYRLAVKTGLVAEDDFLALTGEALGLELLAELPDDYDPRPFMSISPLFLEKHCLLPLRLGDDSLSIVVNDPFDFQVIDTLKQLFPGRTIQSRLGREALIKTWIRTHFAAAEADGEEEADADVKANSGPLYEDTDHLRDLASEAPIIKLVNDFLTGGVEAGASDIHLEPSEDSLRLRFRIDGILHEREFFPSHLQQAIISRVKIMAKMDIAEHRLPQDGRIRSKIAGKDIDLRVSSLPTMYGESVVLRILDRSSVIMSLNQLGFPANEQRQFEELIRRPYGIILVTGPTGSGKTTTLYAALQTINAPDKKIITIEDPVEYELKGINQVQVNTKAGLNFASGLRSIVRQDPDIILIGEIRDRETADIAIQSALTGHLVFSTLHTNDAAGAVTRLIEIGIEDYLLSSSLIGIMAQRLVRVLCPACKETYVPEASLVQRLQLPFVPTDSAPIYRPRGCKACSNSGYQGRIAIFELLQITDDIRSLILENSSSTVIRDAAIANGMTLLRIDGWQKVRAGITSIAEVLRVT